MSVSPHQQVPHAQGQGRFRRLASERQVGVYLASSTGTPRPKTRTLLSPGIRASGRCLSRLINRYPTPKDKDAFSPSSACSPNPTTSRRLCCLVSIRMAGRFFFSLRHQSTLHLTTRMPSSPGTWTAGMCLDLFFPLAQHVPSI